VEKSFAFGWSILRRGPRLDAAVSWVLSSGARAPLPVALFRASGLAHARAGRVAKRKDLRQGGKRGRG